MQKFGIDISKWQGDYNLAQAKDEGVEYVIIKIGGADDGYYVDSQFYNNVNESKAINMPIGGYYFGNAYTVEQAKIEAKHCLNLVKGLSFDYPIFYDVEGKMLSAGYNLTDIVMTFMEEISNAGRKVGLYMSESHMNRYIEISAVKNAGYYLWVARHSDTSPRLKDNITYDIWQFGGDDNYIRDNTVAGVVVDQDYCYTCFTPAVPDTPTKPTEPTEPSKPIDKLKVGDVITLRSGCTYYNGATIPDWVFSVTLYYRGFNDNGVIFSTKPVGDITGIVKESDVMELQTVEPITPNKSIDELAQEVIEGIWGVMPERKERLEAAGYDFDSVQDKVDEIYAEKNNPKPVQTTVVRIKQGAKDLNTNAMYANYVYSREYDVISITDSYVVFGIGTAATGKTAIENVIFV